MFQKEISSKIGNIIAGILVVFGFILRFIVSKSDPFLHAWDERFHALVARNLMHSPLKPMLKAFPITDNYDINSWCCNHIWLHKQPLFMWQMALSMKVFGVNEIAMRLPSVLMGSCMVFLIYRIGIMLFNNHIIALFAAAILAFSTFHIRMCAGIWGMEHNDVAHGFYILASVWAWFEYQRSKKWYWVVLIGLFAGCAILVKWLTGLFVFLLWGLNLMPHLRKFQLSRDMINFGLALIICTVVFLPWQIYISTMWPVQAAFEYEFNRRHITEALEGHVGSIFFYLNFLFKEFFLFVLLIPIGMYTSIANKGVNRNIGLPLLIGTLFVFSFYSLIVKTKVDAHIFYIFPFLFLYFSYAFFQHFTVFRFKIISLILIGFIFYYNIKPKYWIDYYSSENVERNDRIHNAILYKNIRNYIPSDVNVVMNVNSFEDTDVMFYHNDITAYHWTLPEADFKEFEKKKLKIAVFQQHGNYALPEYVNNYPYIYIIKKELKNF